VREQLDRVFADVDARVGFGSLAAGADILAAEALLERGAELHVVLPFDRDEFVRTSVVSAGGDWVQRFERCLASAATVEIASDGEYLDDPVMFDFCARIAMGDALIRARMLETGAHQVAVWDGTPSYGVAGTAVDVRTWGATGAPSTVIPVSHGQPTGGGADDQRDRRHIRAIVFADFAGFSKLSDAQLVEFQTHVMKEMSNRLEPYRPELLSGRTWGDGIYLVFSDVAGAAECALDLANHLIADQGWRTPTTYREVFEILAEQSVLDAKLAEQMQAWAGLRNVLVHVYLEIDHDRIHAMITGELDQLEAFAAAISRAAARAEDRGDSDTA
jgi:uncharacterized protein YutE (UPF0331/DUF86 family)